MKIALCFYGTLGGTTGKAGDRTGSSSDVLKYAHKHYKESILDNNDVDVFIHSWDTQLESEIDSKYKPKGKKFEEQIIFDIPKHLNNDKRTQNHFSRWYSCKESVNLKSQYEKDNEFKYDIVMLARQDLAWNIKIDFNKFDNKYFYVANWYQHHSGEIMGYPWGFYNKSLQDAWCFSNSDNIFPLALILKCKDKNNSLTVIPTLC